MTKPKLGINSKMACLSETIFLVATLGFTASSLGGHWVMNSCVWHSRPRLCFLCSVRDNSCMYSVRTCPALRSVLAHQLPLFIPQNFAVDTVLSFRGRSWCREAAGFIRFIAYPMSGCTAGAAVPRKLEVLLPLKLKEMSSSSPLPFCHPEETL